MGSSHTHKYYKSHIGWGKGKKTVYRCALPDCSHYVAPNAVLLKYSLCWKCGKEFILPKAVSLLTSKPWCPSCAKDRKKVVEPATHTERARPDLDSFIENLIGGKK